MKHGAQLKQGKLILSADAVLVAARTEEDARLATRAQGARPPSPPYVEETPAMPSEVPANWLSYHLAHPGPGVGMPGDPNPAFFYKGRYHLHYIYIRWCASASDEIRGFERLAVHRSLAA